MRSRAWRDVVEFDMGGTVDEPVVCSCLLLCVGSVVERRRGLWPGGEYKMHKYYDENESSKGVLS